MDQDTLTRLNAALRERRCKFALGRRMRLHYTNLHRKLMGQQGINADQWAIIEAFCAEKGIVL